MKTAALVLAAILVVSSLAVIAKSQMAPTPEEPVNQYIRMHRGLI